MGWVIESDVDISGVTVSKLTKGRVSGTCRLRTVRHRPGRADRAGVRSRIRPERPDLDADALPDDGGLRPGARSRARPASPDAEPVQHPERAAPRGQATDHGRARAGGVGTPGEPHRGDRHAHQALPGGAAAQPRGPPVVPGRHHQGRRRVPRRVPAEALAVSRSAHRRPLRAPAQTVDRPARPVPGVDPGGRAVRRIIRRQRSRRRRGRTGQLLSMAVLGADRVVGTDRVDVHAHGLPPALPPLARRYAGDWPELVATGPCTADITLGGRHFRSVDSRCWDAARRLAEMDAEGVALQVVSPIPVTFSYGLDPTGAAELSRLQNEWIAGLVRDHPDRFSGLGTVPLQAPEVAAAMVAEIVAQLGLPGVEIGSNVAGRMLDDPELEPFFAACAECDAVVFVHPWQVLGAGRLTRHGLGYSVGMPAETAAAAASLVFGGVLDRHPRLRVVLAHGGGSFTALLPRIDRCAEMLPGVTAPQQPPSAYARRFWYDSLVYDPEALRRLVATVGADRVMIGTDYPFPIAERPAGQGVTDAGFDDATAAAVRAGTARTLLKL